MVAFSLMSDYEFITPFQDHDDGVIVYTYKGDMNDIKITRTVHYSDHWSDGVGVGATGDHEYDALEVFGVTIEGDKLKELCMELKSIEEGGIFVYVNRLGLCIVTQIRHPSIKAMRINDYFGWSKYDVKVPRQDLIRASAMWNKFDMFNGETMLDVEGLVRTAGKAEELQRRMDHYTGEQAGFMLEIVDLKACNKGLKEKNVELAACNKELEEKNVELVSCKKELEENCMEMAACKKELEEKSVEMTACKKELEWSKKMESLFSKLVEEKEKVNEFMKNQLLASKSN